MKYNNLLHYILHSIEFSFMGWKNIYKYIISLLINKYKSAVCSNMRICTNHFNNVQCDWMFITVFVHELLHLLHPLLTNHASPIPDQENISQLIYLYSYYYNLHRIVFMIAIEYKLHLDRTSEYRKYVSFNSKLCTRLFDQIYAKFPSDCL